jgi:hypothetical protein
MDRAEHHEAAVLSWLHPRRALTDGITESSRSPSKQGVSVTPSRRAKPRFQPLELPIATISCETAIAALSMGSAARWEVPAVTTRAAAPT